MAEEQTRKFDLPWGTLLPLLALLAGVIAQFKPLVSNRPPVPSEKAIPVTAKQDVDARLWQDPIAVAQKQEALLDADIKAGRVSEDPSARHDISTLADLLQERAKSFPEHVLLLAVMLDAGPYSEQGESRLRSRQAVLEGLSESGFVPIDGEHIGFVTTRWAGKASDGSAPLEPALLLPWEECEAIDHPQRVFPRNTRRVVVLWLPAVNFNPEPLHRFAALIARLVPNRDKIDVKLIGPANSTGLQNMIREACENPLAWYMLNGVSIISPRATASESTLLYTNAWVFDVLPEVRISWSEESGGAKIVWPRSFGPADGRPLAGGYFPSLRLETPRKLTEGMRALHFAPTVESDDLMFPPPPPSAAQLIEGGGGLHFVRTVGSDDVVLEELIAELARRGIDVRPRKRKDDTWSWDHVVILTEWDTPYGRSLSTAFAAKASGQNISQIIENQAQRDARNQVVEDKEKKSPEHKTPTNLELLEERGGKSLQERGKQIFEDLPAQILEDEGRPIFAQLPPQILNPRQKEMFEAGQKEIIADLKKQEAGEKQLGHIHFYRYLRGIDGQLPGDSGKDTVREQSQKGQSGQDAVVVEATEGLNQSDYLRRLARELKETNARWKQDGGNGIRAIGLLGADIYDKLMILRALRPEFRSVVFFTNNYDAHFERRDDWDDARNLIIVSPFGRSLPETYSQQHVAPFRDSNQTSMYTGTLVATGKMDGLDADYLSWQPRVFEISRRGAYDLSPEWYLAGKNLSHSNKNWFRDWLFPTWDREKRNLAQFPGVKWQNWLLAVHVIWSSPMFWRLVIGALALLAIAAWISVTVASPELPGGGTTPQRLRRLFASTTFWLVCGVPLIVISVAVFAQYDSAWFVQYESADIAQYEGAAKEPLAFFSGISIWPSEMLRLIALMLAIHFMIKAGIDLRANAREIEKGFSFEPLPKTPFQWRHLGLGLEQWRMPPPDKPGPEPPFSAEHAWHIYLCRNKFGPRFIRIGVLFALYFLFSYIIFRLFPPPLPPARGDFAFQFDWIVIRLAAIGMMILSFYVVDAIQLNSNFIRMFAREVTKWGSAVTERFYRSPPLSEEELSAYNEIFFVAQRTQVVARLIWYPVIVLTLMIVARSSFFDNWSWSPSILAIYGINAAWALGSAVLLRRAAEQLRDAALTNLQMSRVKSHAEEAKLLRREAEPLRDAALKTEEAKRRTFDELIAEIRGLKKGAFAPLTEQPFVRAIIVPSGGLGLLAVGQRLLDIF